MPWNLHEFNNLCKQKQFSLSIEFQNSLGSKIEQADLHAKRAVKIWKEMYNKAEGKSISVNGQLWQKAELESKSQTESVAQILHSMGDNLAQIINKSIFSKLGIQRDIGQVSLKGIKETLSDIDEGVFQSVNNLLESPEFKYIEAFVNTIKHQSIVNHKWMFDSRKPLTRNEIKFKSFKYKSIEYPETWSDTILGEYRTRIIDLICDVGNQLNRYLENHSN
jgi:hypothetical protein